MDFDSMTLDLVWHSLGGGALVAASLALVRVILEYVFRRRVQRKDAEARLEHQFLRDRLHEVTRRVERYELEMDAERDRRTTLERDFALLQQAHHLLNEQFGALQTDHAVLIGEHRLLLAARRPSSSRSQA